MGVGDEKFTQKAYKTIHGFYSKGITLIVASHLYQFIKDNCTRVIALNSGAITYDGPTSKYNF